MARGTPKGRRRYPPGPCFGCGWTRTLHFQLMVKSMATGKGRGAGAIDLCEECWKKATGAARRYRRPRRHDARAIGNPGAAGEVGSGRVEELPPGPGGIS